MSDKIDMEYIRVNYPKEFEQGILPEEFRYREFMYNKYPDVSKNYFDGRPEIVFRDMYGNHMRTIRLEQE